MTSLRKQHVTVDECDTAHGVTLDQLVRGETSKAVKRETSEGYCNIDCH